MFSPYGIPPIIIKRKQRFQTKKQTSQDFTRPQMTSNDLKRPQMTSKDTNEKAKKLKTKNNLKGGNPNDVNPSNGRHNIEQAFSST